MIVERRRGGQLRFADVERWALPLILLVAFVLRLYRLGDKNIWWDEGLAIWAVRKSLLGATLWTAQDVHPPLYFWTLWAWVRLVGESEFAARFISTVWGMLTVAVAYPLGKRLGGQRVGLLAALFLAVARFHIWWSQEMRMYILATLAATLTLYVAVRWLDEEREGSRLLWPLLYVPAAAACLYTIYLAGLAPLVANCYAVAALARVPAARRLRAAGRWLAAQVAALLILVPWLLLALPRMHTWSVAAPFNFGLFSKLYAILLTIGISIEIERYTLFLLPFGLVMLGGLVTVWWSRRRPEPGLPGPQVALFFILALGWLPLAVYVLTRPRSLFYTPRIEARYLLLFAPVFYIFLAWSAVRLGRRIRALGLAAVMVSLGLMLAFLPGYYEGRYLRDEMQGMARILGACARPGDVALLISGDRYQLFGYYYERIVPPERRIPILELPQGGQDFSPENVDAQLLTATANRGRFWVASVEAGIQDPQGLSLPWLDQHFTRAMTYDVGYNALILYGNEPEPLRVAPETLAPQYPLAVRSADLAVLGYDLPGREYRAGDTVDLGLYYAAGASTEVTVEWRRDNGELLQTIGQNWQPTGQAAARAAVRCKVWPWYRGGGTYFLLRWEGAPEMVRLRGPHILEAPDRPRPERIAQPLDIALGGSIRLRGFDLHRPVREGKCQARAGETLILDLFWEATGPVDQDYTVFTQLLGSSHNPKTGGPLWSQHDGPPVGGEYATGTWAPGQLIADRHVLEIDPAAPAGDYELVAGMYLPSTGERLRLAGGEDHVVLAHIAVQH